MDMKNVDDVRICSFAVVWYHTYCVLIWYKPDLCTLAYVPGISCRTCDSSISLGLELEFFCYSQPMWLPFTFSPFIQTWLLMQSLQHKQCYVCILCVEFESNSARACHIERHWDCIVAMHKTRGTMWRRTFVIVVVVVVEYCVRLHCARFRFPCT